LALVAFSIGFNTARYPIVWEMVSPARASEKAQPSAPSPPEQPASRPPAPPQRPAPPRKAEPIAVKPAPKPPAPKVAKKSVADDSRPTSAGPASGRAAANDKATPAEAKPQKRLVPVTQVTLANAPANETTGAAVIRRLPPVEPTDSSSANRQPAMFSGGSIPVYPTTGIE
jgi:outer membrane biosynthesis protein TonB